MAIVKTMFVGTTLAAQASELLTYLQANTNAFFDTISADSDGNISCYVGETAALIIGMDGTTTRKVTLKNGASIEVSSTAGTSAGTVPKSTLFRYAKKTANGVLLVTYAGTIGGSEVGATTTFITKNENGDTVIYGYFQTTNNSTNTATYFFADIDNDTTIFTPLTNTAYVNRGQLSHSAPTTALTPVIFSGGHYAPKAYIATFNQFALTECDININGRSYASDGVCVLSD